jgi:hypothetical protein
MTNSEPDFRNGTSEYRLRELIHGNYQAHVGDNSGVGLKLVVESARESRRRLARQNKKFKQTTAFDILNQLN